MGEKGGGVGWGGVRWGGVGRGGARRGGVGWAGWGGRVGRGAGVAPNPHTLPFTKHSLPSTACGGVGARTVLWAGRRRFRASDTVGDRVVAVV